MKSICWPDAFSGPFNLDEYETSNCCIFFWLLLGRVRGNSSAVCARSIRCCTRSDSPTRKKRSIARAADATCEQSRTPERVRTERTFSAFRTHGAECAFGTGCTQRPECPFRAVCTQSAQRSICAERSACPFRAVGTVGATTAAQDSGTHDSTAEHPDADHPFESNPGAVNRRTHLTNAAIPVAENSKLKR